MRPLAAVLVLTACGGGPRPAPAPAAGNEASDEVRLLDGDPRGLRAGERATYAMTLAGIELGDAAFAVGEPGERDGRPEIIVRSRAEATGLISLVRELGAEGQARIDNATGWPIHAEGTLTWGGKRFRGDLAYDGATVDGGWYDSAGTMVESVYRSTPGPPAHNVYSAMSAVRAWDGEPGQRRELYLHGAVEVWRTELTWVGREVIGTTRGNVAAIRIEGTCMVNENREWAIHAQLWISDDADRVPLRLDVKVWKFETTFELTEYLAVGATLDD